MHPHKIFQQYLWLVTTIRRSGGITLDDLNQRWLQTTLSDGHHLSRSTFVRHKEAIQDMFGIVIECDVHNDYKYSIVNDHELLNDSIQNWMLSTLGVSTLLSESVGVHDRILLESVPSSGSELGIFIDAMKSGHRIRVRYRRYGADEVSDRIVDPYCIKLFNCRWYGLVKHLQRGTLYVISFDRIQSIELTNQSFEIDPDFDAHAFFAESYGIVTKPDAKLERIVIRAYGSEPYYLRDLPLHSSQTELASDDGYTDFEYHFRISADFYPALLAKGPNIQVLEPEWLVEEIKGQTARMVELYK